MSTLYAKLPIFAQNVACSLYGYREKRKRMGALFWERYRWLLETESATPETIAIYQNSQIDRMVELAYHTVPYYRRMLDQHGLAPSDIRTRSDLSKLPILRKEDVISSYTDLFARGYSRRNIYERRTSGTTGSAMPFASSRDSIAFQWAVWWRHRARFGIEPCPWHVNFTGKIVVPQAQSEPPYWRWNLPMRQALINMQQVTSAKTKALATFLDRGCFVFYSGYPSILHALAMHLEEQNLTIVNGPSLIFLGAENVQAFQKSGIESAFHARVTDQYGLSEGCGNASRCEHDSYHEDWEFGLLQCEDPETLPGGEKRGRIIATGFSNDAFPFIRYETGDFGVWAPEGYRCPCGRASQVIKSIEGRVEDYVITPEGHQVMRFDYLFKHTDHVKEAQVVQERHGEIIIKVVPRLGYSKDDEVIIVKAVRDWISPTLRVSVEKVDKIERGLNGKFRPVLSQLRRQQHPALS
jgi:phenylacetate-CoA ligase